MFRKTSRLAQRFHGPDFRVYTSDDLVGVQVGGLLGGSVVVESVFAWPGLGQLAFEALFSRDYNLLLGIFFMSACLVVLVNLIVDIVYVLLDPRITVGA